MHNEGAEATGRDEINVSVNSQLGHARLSSLSGLEGRYSTRKSKIRPELRVRQKQCPRKRATAVEKSCTFQFPCASRKGTVGHREREAETEREKSISVGVQVHIKLRR